MIRKKLNDVNSFNDSFNNLNGLIIYFKDRNNKSKKKYENYEILTTTLKSFETIVNLATTSNSIMFSFIGIGLIAITLSSSVECGLTVSYNVFYEVVTQKFF